MQFRRLTFALWLTVASCSVAEPIETLDLDSKVLAANPLGDPARRRIAVLSPDRLSRGERAPLIVYLPGWGGSSEDYLRPGGGAGFLRVLNELAKEGKPMRIAVVDGRSRYGGSQFVNSNATGRYADFVADEAVKALQKDYPFPAGQCWVAGHSSGAYGALRLAMDRPEVFSTVVALSPDSDFEVTHKPLVQQPSVRALTAAELAAAMAPADQQRQPADGLARLVAGLCANYTAIAPGKFAWLYDPQGNWQPDVWARWIALDPLTLVRQNQNAFQPTQRVYLDGAEFDEFGANIGARKIYEALRTRKTPVAFNEPAGHHSDHLPERLLQGIRWALSVGK